MEHQLLASESSVDRVSARCVAHVVQATAVIAKTLEADSVAQQAKELVQSRRWIPFN